MGRPRQRRSACSRPNRAIASPPDKELQRIEIWADGVCPFQMQHGRYYVRPVILLDLTDRARDAQLSISFRLIRKRRAIIEIAVCCA